jgi:hypothetical protein
MTDRIDLDGKTYSTEGNLKEAQNSESDLSALLSCKSCHGEPSLRRGKNADYVFYCCDNQGRHLTSRRATQYWNAVNAR